MTDDDCMRIKTKQFLRTALGTFEDENWVTSVHPGKIHKNIGESIVNELFAQLHLYINESVSNVRVKSKIWDEIMEMLEAFYIRDIAMEEQILSILTKQDLKLDSEAVQKNRAIIDKIYLQSKQTGYAIVLMLMFRGNLEKGDLKKFMHEC